MRCLCVFGDNQYTLISQMSVISRINCTYLVHATTDTFATRSVLLRIAPKRSRRSTTSLSSSLNTHLLNLAANKHHDPQGRGANLAGLPGDVDGGGTSGKNEHFATGAFLSSLLALHLQNLPRHSLDEWIDAPSVFLVTIRHVSAVL